MRATLPFILALALLGGCAAKDEPAPAGQPAAGQPAGEAAAPPAAEAPTGGHPALNKLQETRTKIGEIEAKRAEDQKAAEGEAAGQNP